MQLEIYTAPTSKNSGTMVYPLVSIITVNYNQTGVTRELLRSLRDVTYPCLEIILVDNASADQSIEALAHEFPEIIYIQTGQNLGFAGGNNVGIKASKGDYIFLVNNDVEVTPHFLEPLVDIMEENPKVGMASPKVLYPDRKTIQYAGTTSINPITGRGKTIGLFESDRGQYDKIYKTDLGHGAALLVRRKVIEDVGMMPEIYFLYYEEHDWCEQVKRMGYEMYYVGISSVIHKESVSMGGTESFIKVHYLHRNRLLYLRRNTEGFSFILGLIFLFGVAIPKKVLLFLLRGKFDLIRAVGKGISWNFSNPKLTTDDHVIRP
jgi:GT2 family glycosyltransferase